MPLVGETCLQGFLPESLQEVRGASRKSVPEAEGPQRQQAAQDDWVKHRIYTQEIWILVQK